MILGIDFGLTNTHVVGVKNNKIVYKANSPKEKRLIVPKEVDEIYYSGNYDNKEIIKKDEIISLGKVL